MLQLTGVIERPTRLERDPAASLTCHFRVFSAKVKFTTPPSSDIYNLEWLLKSTLI